MNIRELYFRSRNLLIKPAVEFKAIANENQSIKGLNKSLVIPFAGLVGLSELLGSIFIHLSSPLDSYIFVFLSAAIVFLIVFIQTYFSGKLIALLGKNINSNNHKESAYALVAYSQIPFYLALAFIKIFPELIFLIIFGIYSIYLLYKGIDILLKIPLIRKMQFLILSVMIMLVLFITVSELLTLLYLKIIELF